MSDSQTVIGIPSSQEDKKQVNNMSVKKMIAIMLVAQLLIVSSFVGAEMVGRQSGFSLFGGSGLGQLAANQASNAMDSTSAAISGAAQQGGQMSSSGMMQSMSNLVTGLAQDEKEMLQREIGVAVRILNLANDRLMATNSMADLNRDNMMQFGQELAALSMDSTRSLAQPVGSMFNRIMGRI